MKKKKSGQLDKFVFPEGKAHNEALLRFVGKHCRQYRYELKAEYFHPNKKIRTQVEDKVRKDHSCDSWLALVECWHSPKSQRFAMKGKEARASQDHFHTNGCTNFANTRPNFMDAHGRGPNRLELLKLTHQNKDGKYVANTTSEDFMKEENTNDDANVANSSPSESRVKIRNDAFNDLMYEKDEPVQQPLGYGFGVRRSDVFGAHVELSERGSTSMTSHLDAKKAQLRKENAENCELINL